MPRDVLTEQLEKIQTVATLSEQEKLAIMRLYSARAFPCALDRQGRLSLPPAYVQDLGFAGEVMLVGAWRHIEIWKPAQWKDYASRADTILSVGAQALGI
ncbi:MAG: division/cell wall cluster transcriptional repressor MraZ [Verrucomicrobiales bacterium]